MANTFFQFKQFTVHQQLCAMKVSTDACFFGAVTAQRLAVAALQPGSSPLVYLDVGTGTGLLSLMIAQKTPAFIEAVEIDDGAYRQASSNFSASPFNDRLTVSREDILQFKPRQTYDAIICNPPFYEGDLRSPDANKNAAKHDTGLRVQQLLHFVTVHLTGNGIFAVLLPYHRLQECIAAAAELHLYPTEQIALRHSIQHSCFRVILFFGRSVAFPVVKDIAIKNDSGDYTDTFIELLKDYYLDI